MNRFNTLLQREWMQHKFGWMVVVAAPLAIALLVLVFGQIQLDIDGTEAATRLSTVPAVGLALVGAIGLSVLTFLIAWATSLIQAPGLARRDQQDRSIEFWLSLPTGHVPSVAAPMLAHLLLFPLAAYAAGVVGGQLIGLILVTKFAGLGAWFSLPWGTVLVTTFALSARLVLGLVLATLWLSPLILLTMAASAWLKRWGLPAVIAFFAVIGNLLDKLYGNPIIVDTLARLTENAGRAFITGQKPGGLSFRPGVDPTAMLAEFPRVMWEDGLHAIGAVADPMMIFALAMSAACFALLILRRQRGA